MGKYVLQGQKIRFIREASQEIRPLVSLDEGTYWPISHEPNRGWDFEEPYHEEPYRGFEEPNQVSHEAPNRGNQAYDGELHHTVTYL
jgi:hypothetical protein